MNFWLGTVNLDIMKINHIVPSFLHITTITAALNKTVWSKDGRTIMVGDAKGSVHLVSVQESSVKSRCG